MSVKGTLTTNIKSSSWAGVMILQSEAGSKQVFKGICMRLKTIKYYKEIAPENFHHTCIWIDPWSPYHFLDKFAQNSQKTNHFVNLLQRPPLTSTKYGHNLKLETAGRGGEFNFYKKIFKYCYPKIAFFYGPCKRGTSFTLPMR